MSTAEAGYSQSEFCAKTGLTRRQAIHFSELGLVMADKRPGRGRVRRFTPENIAEARLAKSLLDYQIHTPLVVSIMGLVRGFFAQMVNYPNRPQSIPGGLYEIEKENPVWLVLLDHSVVALRFVVGGDLHYTPYVKMLPNHRLTGLFPWDQTVYDSAFARLEFNLAKVLGSMGDHDL